MSSNEESTLFAIYTLGYTFFSLVMIAPPTEFVAAGLTVQNMLASFLGSEELGFIYFHIKRTAATLLIHSCFPLGYFLGLRYVSPLQHLYWFPYFAWYWQIYLTISLFIIICASAVVFYWSTGNWSRHPIAKELSYLTNNAGSWRAVASSINVEFRRFDKFTSGPHGRRVIVTDSWVMKTSTYFLNIAHQNDIHLTLSKSEEHSLSYESMTSVQYLNISVVSINKKVTPFQIRLNSLEYRDLKEKLSGPIRNARNIVIKQSLSDQFLEAFHEQVNLNHDFRLPLNMDCDNCIGCMQKESDVKLVKLCDDQEAGNCVQCFCRPMWCLECMGKWFASRQNQQRPEIWMSGKSPCPTCRATFCVLDVCKIVK
ncbi:E3 ubiquitin-protein ligase TM129-like [Mytilus trossulus]|uniref:E3 ubiquitin-protein ligase TM129-like n=1 Tax=Mytilus trossulus TaxID=6551 RepID=UPI003005E559